MKRSMLFILAIPALVFFSCKKKNNENSTISAPDFIKLKIGNYWVYNYYKVDTNGVETNLGQTDSSYIEKDTVINGRTFLIECVHTYFDGLRRSILRDSSGYLLRRIPDGSSVIDFARDNFTDILFSDSIETFIFRQEMMTGKDSTVSVPAGSFITRSLRIVDAPLDPTYPWGDRTLYCIYGKEAGLIKYTMCYWDSPDYIEARLVRYHVE
jgi:hypothetical protein